jgi:hypothetical protein
MDSGNLWIVGPNLLTIPRNWLSNHETNTLVSVVFLIEMVVHLLSSSLLRTQPLWPTFPNTANNIEDTEGYEHGRRPLSLWNYSRTNAFSTLFVQRRSSWFCLVLKLRFARSFLFYSIFLISQTVSPTKRIHLVAFQINVVTKERRDWCAGEVKQGGVNLLPNCLIPCRNWRQTSTQTFWALHYWMQTGSKLKQSVANVTASPLLIYTLVI